MYFSKCKYFTTVHLWLTLYVTIKCNLALQQVLHLCKGLVTFKQVLHQDTTITSNSTLYTELKHPFNLYN